MRKTDIGRSERRAFSITSYFNLRNNIVGSDRWIPNYTGPKLRRMDESWYSDVQHARNLPFQKLISFKKPSNVPKPSHPPTFSTSS